MDDSTSALCMTVMDEVHIGSQFGNTFRGEFGLLKSRLYQKIPSCCKINLFMMGTCNKTIQTTNFKKLLGVKINNMHWPDHHKMWHHCVSIELKYTKMIMKEVKNKRMPLLIPGCMDAEKKIIIY